MTGSEIRVAFPGVGTNDGKRTDFLRQEIDLQLFLNRRFEFYGRTLRLIKLTATGCDAGRNPSTTNTTADAVQVDEQFKVFASASYCQVDSTDRFYYDELSRRKVVSVSAVPSSLGEDRLAAHDPYEWNYVPTLDVMERHLGDWTCRGLAGRPGRYGAQGRAALGKPRVFALVWSNPSGLNPVLDPLRQSVSACGVRFAVEAGLPQDATAQTDYQNAVLRMRQEGVTTVLTLQQTGYTGILMDAATNQGYFPEWFVSSFFYGDEESLARVFWPQQQGASAFGVTFYNRNLLLGDEPLIWALKEVDPSFGYDSSDLAGGQFDVDKQAYKSLLVLASGIQMAGPRLTPQTFRDGLLRARFPNPGAAGPPYFQARIGFGSNDHTGNDDGAIYWYSPGTPSTNGAAGRMCYLSDGRRYTIGTYPGNDDGLFTAACP